MKKENCPTPHISAKKGDIAKTVIMPGDPMRAKFIAEKYLHDVRIVSEVRSILAYTGKYKGQEITVMASGMGMPSIGIYSYELYNFYDVENIIRVGSAGAIQEGIEVHDIIFALSASTNSDYQKNFQLSGHFAPTADFSLIKSFSQRAEEKRINYHAGNVLSSDIFYHDEKDEFKKWQKMGVLAIEMEAAALYMNAARSGKKALAVLTVSDSLITGASLSSVEREQSFSTMIELTLESVVSL